MNKFSAAKGMGSVTSPVLIGSLLNSCSFALLVVQASAYFAYVALNLLMNTSGLDIYHLCFTKDSRLVKYLVCSTLFAITFDTCLNEFWYAVSYTFGSLVATPRTYSSRSSCMTTLGRFHIVQPRRALTHSFFQLLQASMNASTRLVAKDVVQVILETSSFSATVALVVLILFVSCSDVRASANDVASSSDAIFGMSNVQARQIRTR
ncbi:hypothetical protein K438DRAFT_1762222 [Mycena galopus ATCC 62051]|nr:hypothetical protein K438DRAFT_1762222 [Mycena galopus ATCC 62051]